MMMMGRSELCAWLRANSSGIYRPADEAADEIERLAAAKDQHFAQAMANGAAANELREALAYMVANIGQPRALETRDGFARAEALLKRCALVPPNVGVEAPEGSPRTTG